MLSPILVEKLAPAESEAHNDPFRIPMSHNKPIQGESAMKSFFLRSASCAIAVLICVSGPIWGEIVVKQEMAGPIETNCYLIYDSVSKEAAIVDAVGPVPSLLEIIEKNNLKLKYILATHSHMDHIEGIPNLKKKFPDALFAINKKEWENLFLFKDWVEKNADPKELTGMKQNPEIAKWFEYNPSSFFPVPDIYLEDNQTYALGESKIVTFLTPGHSAGGTSFLAGDRLFSGDLLFYRTAGRTDSIGGSKSELVKSIKRLYSTLPDSTKVYPGHGPLTDIASEKKENKIVKSDSLPDGPLTRP
jgi:glyoxylase-like metal-dependent hydrolase (beta-lactamase superfamily II)